MLPYYLFPMDLGGVPLYGLIHKFEMMFEASRGEFWLRSRGWNGTFFLDCDVFCEEGCNHMFSMELDNRWQVEWKNDVVHTAKDFADLFSEHLFSFQDREQMQELLDRLYTLRAFLA